MATEPKNLKEAKDIIENLEAKTAELSATASEQESIIADLRAELSSTKKEVTASKTIVEHEGKKYEVAIGKFSFLGEIHLASELSAKPEVIAALITEESSVLIEVN